VKVEEAETIVEAFEKGEWISLEELEKARWILALREILRKFVEYVGLEIEENVLDAFVEEVMSYAEI